MPTSVVQVNGVANGNTRAKRVKNGLVDVMTCEPALIWNKRVPDTELEKFRKYIQDKYKVYFSSYWEFHKWSVDNYINFWAELWDYYQVIYSEPYDQVLKKVGPGFLDNEWFSGAKMNYAENLLRYRNNELALIYADESGNEEFITYAQMYEEVRLYAAAFRKHGLQIGDRVACYMSNRKEAIYALLATMSIGGIWGGPLPFYGSRAATNIVKIMEPKFLIAVDHHQDNGLQFHNIDNLATIVDSVASIEKVIIIPTKKDTLFRDISDIRNSCFLEDFLASGKHNGSVPELKFEQLPFNQPAFLNFTSGTTGLPKGPVHSAGTFLSIMRDFGLHLNMKKGDVALTCYPVGWSLWDYFVPCLAMGVTVVLYCGTPCYEAKSGINLWDLFARYKVKFTFVATSIVEKMEKSQMYPRPNTDLSALKYIGIGGSPVKKQNFEFLQKAKKGVFVGSMYGATEVFGAFSGSDMNSPSYGGEIQLPALGVDMKCFDHKGNSIIGQRGEVVIATPTPSLPIFLWKDTNNDRLNDTYFTKFPGVWSQNDECWINPRTNGFIVIGRSDDTLKQNEERFGPEDIYFAIHNMEELQDYICVGQDGYNGDTRAVLFVKLKEGYNFTSNLKDKIAQTISKELWVDYVPEIILETKDVPYNLNNKRMESVVRKIVATNIVPEVMNIKNPECLSNYCNFPELMNYNKQ